MKIVDSNGKVIEALNENTDAQNKNTGATNKNTDENKKTKGASAQRANIEKLTTPQLFERLTGGVFPSNLKEDTAAIQATEQFNQRRLDADKKLLEQQNRINGNLQSYNKSLALLDGKTKEQVAVAEKSTEAAIRARDAKESVAVNISLASNAEEQNADLSKQIAKDSKDISKTQKELEAAKRFNADQEKAAMIGFGGVGGGAGALGGRGLGKIAFDKSDEFAGFIIDKFVAAQRGAFGRLGNKIANSLISRGGNATDASLKATRTAAGGVGATAGVATGGGVGKMIADWSGETRVKKLEAQEQKLNDKVEKNNELRQRNNEIIAEGGKAIQMAVVYTEDAANASQDELDTENRLTQLAKEKEGFESKAANASLARVRAQAENAAAIVAINAEQMAFELSLAKASEEKNRRDSIINEILLRRTQIAQNEIDLGEEAARFANEKLQNIIRTLEISLQEISEEERKVLLLEQQAAHQTRLNSLQTDAVNKAKEAMAIAQTQALEAANRERTALNELRLLWETNAIKKASLQYNFEMLRIDNANLTVIERELEEKKALLAYEEAITAERIKQVQATSQGIGGLGSLGGQFGGMMEKLGFDKETARVVDEISTGLVGVGQGVGGVAQIMAGDPVGGITNLLSGGLTAFESIYDIFNPEEEKIDPAEYAQIEIDAETLREQAREFAQAFVDEQEKRMSRPVQITIDARGALVGEENEVARQLGNLLESEIGRRVGNISRSF